MATKTILSTIFRRHCGYNLHGLPENRCTECGKPFDPSDRKTYSNRSGSTSRRRWVKRIALSILVLFILTSAGIFTLWWPWHREQAAVQMIHQYRGGRIQTKTVGPRWLQKLLGQRGDFLLERVEDIDFQGDAVTDQDLALLKRLSGLDSLRLEATAVTDVGLENLKDLSGLQMLWLSETAVTDEGLEHLKNLNGLQVLILDDSAVTDKGLSYLKDMKQLQILVLDRTRITDAGLERLKDLKGLQYLRLNDTAVTDAGLEHLKELKGLQSLWLSNSAVTQAGMAALRKALPGCNIYWTSMELN